MKLRNKKTGEIVETDCAFGVSIPTDRFMGCKSYDQIAEYNSLAELNEEWEDYGTAEPLIKDEKIRKAVRAWAEALDLRWFKRCGSVNAHTSRLYGQDANGTGYTMELAPNDLYGDSISKKGYTIAELCGEEEE